MATYTFYGYSASALVYDAGTNAFVLSPDYDLTTDRILVTITDDDSHFGGDVNADEVGSDTNQTAVVSLPDGTVIASGRIYDENYSVVSGPGGSHIELDRIEIGGVHLGYFTTEPLVAGQSYPHQGTYNVSVSGGTTLTYSQIGTVPCFAEGTRIATDGGETPVERLCIGDRILTLDDGYQPLLWSGRFRAGGSAPCPDRVVIPPGSLGPCLPRRSLTVTSCHRLMLAGAEVALHFGDREVLAAAGHLAECRGFDICPAVPDETFHHILLPSHQIVLANGVWSETLFAASAVVARMAPPVRRHILRLAGTGHHQTARPCLRRWEVALIAGGCGKPLVQAA
ncbi:MAG: Hint domain-containing protein [Rhodobacteraceae bacterium]|nr:Hint domain-containing protein [Paracoccaceae bacterium]